MKNSKHKDHFDTRRNFLCRSACGALGVTSIVNTLAHLRLVQSAMAQSAPSDYKAIICLFLYGGNDSNNTLVPLDGSARTNYESARPVGHPIHIPVSGTGAALPLTAPSGGFGQSSATQFGVHPNMGNVQSMFNSGDLAFVANVGTLVQPITRSQYIAVPRSVPVPPQLFSHSDQQLQWQSSLPDRPFQNGWGGRAADLLTAANVNPASNVSMNISISGQNSFQVGSSVVQYAVSTSGVVGLSGYSSSSPYFGPGTYGHAANYDVSPVAYSPNDAGKTLKALDTITKLTRMQLGETESHYQHHLEEGYNEVMKRARDNEAIVGSALGGSTTSIDTAFTNAFPGVTTLPDVANQLKMVARLIQGRSSLGNNRQIFFVSMNGFDTHQNQPTDHGNLMGNLDKSLKGFKDAIAAVDPSLWDDVLLFTHSDFTRTLQPNGNETGSGTDHGWGGHQIVMGGPVIGQRIYGTFPDLARAAGQDVDSNRGRWIPTTAVDQYASVAAKWFMSEGTNYVSGVTGTDINTIFPNLGRFQNIGTIPSNLGFVDFTA
ncbi:Uncharacterized conserved protein, DUF1501 family [Prosthecobacter debontii]|uniref:Uncharacterized conserved protein, DUF1501 family n=1 Tax=Prosthecobacter debontii TaxID=48467 RepID=A0A1T4YIR9_9BACT|nr:DUF1501 domain-containing protein [Prosthecobacter debontii]SKB01689.1 Uncharacterized conserved protein, DUF1501 family [Prosthecobacter debontii]